MPHSFVTPEIGSVAIGTVLLLFALLIGLRLRFRKQLLTLRAEHARATEKIAAEHRQEVSALKAAHQQALARQEAEHSKTLRAEHARATEKIAVEHRQAVSALKAAHQEALARQEAEHSKAVRRFAAIIDQEKEVERLRQVARENTRKAAAQLRKLSAEAGAMQENIAELRQSYKEKRTVYDRLVSQLAIFDERLAFAELGVYEPHFDYGDSASFKAAITEERAAQKAMVKAKTAVFCATTWTVDGSKAKGETLTNRGIRLTLRAFNNECEAAIANTRWNNALAMEKRIRTAHKAIDDLNRSSSIVVSDAYLDSKLRELRLTHEYREKLKQERDERAEVARQAREEKRLQKEADQAHKEEERFQTLLAQAREEAGVVDLESHQRKIEALERQLAEAHERNERAQAMAEHTKTGFVYIISNIGSFGEDVVKIGLTRRLDPMDRVRELGDASVPFLFDTHAMIYSEEAPALEHALHSEFSARRANASNMRKEFFRVSLEEVESAVRRLAPEAEFHRDIEAQEYHETLSRRQEMAAMAQREAEAHLPESI